MSISSCQNLRKFALPWLLAPENCKANSDNFRLARNRTRKHVLTILMDHHLIENSLDRSATNGDSIIPKLEKAETWQTTWMLRWWCTGWVGLSGRNWMTFWFWCMRLSICHPRFISHWTFGFNLDSGSPSANHYEPAHATLTTTVILHLLARLFSLCQCQGKSVIVYSIICKPC